MNLVDLKLATDLYVRKLESLHEHIDPQNKITTDLKKRMIRSESEINNLNQYSRRSHLKIYGSEIERNNGSCKKQVVALFNSMKDSQNSLTIERAHGTGRHTSSGRTVVVKLASFKDRSQVLKWAKTMKPAGIFINEDFSKKVMEKRKSLMPEMIRQRQISRSTNS